jgi:PAS domain S-box-containing protein
VKLWKIYRNTIHSNCTDGDDSVHGLAYWRNQLFATILVYCVPLGIFAAVPGTILSFLTSKIYLGICDAIIMELVVLISFNRRLSITSRKILFIALLYILSIVLIYYVGSLGAGLMYLLVTTIFCVLIFSTRSAYLSVGINTLICAVFGFIITSNWLQDSFVHQYTLGAWFVTSINLIVLSILIVLLLPLLFKGLYQSNERYEMVSKATSDVICDWDIVKDITTYSDGMQTMLGYGPGDIESTTDWWWSKIHPDDKERVDKAVSQTMQNGDLHLNIEYRFRCADGTYKHILDRAYILYDANNKAIRVIGAMQDINELKEREHWVKLLGSVITNATDAVLIVGVDEHDTTNRVIQYANEAYADMVGYDNKDELIGLKTQLLYGPETDSMELARLEALITEGGSYQGEIINYKKSGEAFWTSKTVSPVRDGSDKVTHWISVERDVTERNNYVRAIEDQNKKLKAISWTQSHVVRGPLTRIMGLVNLLMTLSPDSIDTKELGYIQSSANEFDEIVKDIIRNAESEGERVE